MLIRSVFLVLLTAGSLSARPLTLNFEVDKTRKPASGAPETSHFQLRVDLGTSALHYSDGSREALFDFNTLRSYQWTPDVREENSLYTVCGGRYAELQKRARVAASQAKEGETSFGEALLEHLLAMNLEGGKESPAWAPAPEFKASFGDRLLAEASGEPRSLEKDEAHAYVRFLRYYVGAHPDILERLESRSEVPQNLTVVHYAGDEERRVTFHLKSVADLTTELTPPPPLSTAPPETTPLQRALRSVNSTTPEQFARRNQATLNQAEKDRIAGKFFQALLRYFDYILATGREMPAAFKKDPSQFERLAESKALLGALREDDPKKAAQMLQGLEKKARDLSYILQVFRAGLLTDLESERAGLDLYLQALEKQPLLLGAWKDVGDIFYRNYLAEEAWKCWDAALRLGRNHEMLSSVKELEAELRHDYPGYF